MYRSKTLPEFIHERNSDTDEDGNYPAYYFGFELNYIAKTYFGLVITEKKMDQIVWREVDDIASEATVQESLSCSAIEMVLKVYNKHLVSAYRDFQKRDFIDGPWIDRAGFIPVIKSYDAGTLINDIITFYRDGFPLAVRTLVHFLKDILDPLIFKIYGCVLQTSFYRKIATDFKQQVDNNPGLVITGTAVDYFLLIMLPLITESIEQFSLASKRFKEVVQHMGASFSY
jgi:hypothetical protein